jgi:xanthine dehydrogenase YagS FAD-binding subunit
VNIAAAFSMNGNTIDEARLVVGGVAARPLRLAEAEDAIRGRARNEDTGRIAAEISTRGAVPLRHNGYKIPLMQNLVKRAIRGEAPWTS